MGERGVAKGKGRLRGENLYRERGNPWTKAEGGETCVYCRLGLRKGEDMVKLWDGACCRRCFHLEIQPNRIGISTGAMQKVRDRAVQRRK